MSYLKHGDYAITLFVSSSGKGASSSATGVSPDEPVTLERAVALANLQADESVLILLGSGTYSLDNPITLTGTNVALAAFSQGVTGTTKTAGTVTITNTVIYSPADPGVFSAYGLRISSNLSFTVQGASSAVRLEGCVAKIMQVNVATETLSVSVDRCAFDEIQYGDQLGGGGSLAVNESSLGAFTLVFGGVGVGDVLESMTVTDSSIQTFLVYFRSNLSNLTLNNSTIADFTTQSDKTMNLTADQSTIQTFEVLDLTGGTWRFTDCKTGALQGGSGTFPAAVETWFDNTLVAGNGEILPYTPEFDNASAENIPEWPRFSGAIIEAPLDDTGSITHLFGTRNADGGLVRTVDAADFLRHVSASYTLHLSAPVGGPISFGPSIPAGSYAFAVQVGVIGAGAATAALAVQDSAASTLLSVPDLSIPGSYGGLQIDALAAGQLQLNFTGSGMTGTIFVIVRYVTI